MVVAVSRSTVCKFVRLLVNASFSSRPLCPGVNVKFLTFCIVDGNHLQKRLVIWRAQNSTMFLRDLLRFYLILSLVGVPRGWF